MIKNYLVILFVSICLGSLSAQTFTGRLNPFPSPKTITTGNRQDTLRILAVMVEFQKDQDAATDGNGKFGSIYTQDYGDSILDPLPHDRAYFEEHLEFAKNYFQKVSAGKLFVEFYVLPQVITVSQRMRNYSPQINSDDFTPLADFSKEVWSKADSANPGFNFGKYNLFTIFHAGVGRDVSLPGSINDSRDLPSVYLSPLALQKIFGSGFKGFPVQNNSFDITNSLIMPETESREQSTYGGTVLYQITINGLLVANIASYLGLPDLFDTQTGLSAIGRFGLMDPQSIFAYNGVFPPEPSAWEKIYLGWATPVTLNVHNYKNYSINLFASLAANAADTTILKVPINSSEYFLIENRERDAYNNGCKITYVLKGDTLNETFKQDQTGFNNVDTDSLKGVITDVDEFDWALPGVIDDTADYKGGILIWHIDNNVINASLSDNKINANLNHRGVNLMEASGVPEIGQMFTDVLGDQVVGEGTYEDYWYKNNPAYLYKNKFASDTRPSSNANTGANSLITIFNFSNIGNEISFNLTYGDSIVKPIFSAITPVTSNKVNLTLLQNGSIFGFGIISNSSLILTDEKGNVKLSLPGFSNYKTASMSYNGDQYVYGVSDTSLNVLNTSTQKVKTFHASSTPSTAPVIQYNTDNKPSKILVGTINGTILQYTFDQNMMPKVDGEINTNNSGLVINKVCANQNTVSYIGSKAGNSEFIAGDETGTYSGTGEVLDFAMSMDNSGKIYEVILLSGNKFIVISGGKAIHQFNINSSDTISSFALADLKQDGSNYIIFSNGNNVDAVNLQGAEAVNFPFVDPLRIGFAGAPVTANFAGNSGSDIIAETTDGRIFAIDGNSGGVISGFPISAGARFISSPALFEYNSNISMAAIDMNKNLSAWEIGNSAGNVYWAEENGNNLNTSFIPAASGINTVGTFFPANMAYNYPNPVYGNVTNIHYYVAEDSKIDIKIFDLAGDFVAELKDNAQGGMQKETPWNVSNIQSGVYFARIQAVSSGGKSETNIIKIAVIK